MVFKEINVYIKLQEIVRSHYSYFVIRRLLYYLKTEHKILLCTNLKKIFYKIKQSKNLIKWQNLIEMALANKLNFSNSYNCIDNNYILNSLNKESTSTTVESSGSNLEQLLELQKNRIKDINLINSPSKKIKDKKINLNLNQGYSKLEGSTSQFTIPTPEIKKENNLDKEEKVCVLEKNKQKKIKKVNFNLKNLPGDVRRKSCVVKSNIGLPNNLEYDQSLENGKNMYNNNFIGNDISDINSKNIEENCSNNYLIPEDFLDNHYRNINMSNSLISSESNQNMNNVDPYLNSPFYNNQFNNNLNPYQNNNSNKSFQGNVGQRRLSNPHNNLNNTDYQLFNHSNCSQSFDNNYLLNKSTPSINNKNFSSFHNNNINNNSFHNNNNNNNNSFYNNNNNNNSFYNNSFHNINNSFNSNNNNSFNNYQIMTNQQHKVNQKSLFSNYQNNPNLQQNMNNSLNPNSFNHNCNNSNISQGYNNSLGLSYIDHHQNLSFPNVYDTDSPEITNKQLHNFNNNRHQNMNQNINQNINQITPNLQYNQLNNIQINPNLQYNQGNNMQINHNLQYNQGNNMNQINNNYQSGNMYGNYNHNNNFNQVNQINNTNMYNDINNKNNCDVKIHDSPYSDNMYYNALSHKNKITQKQNQNNINQTSTNNDYLNMNNNIPT